MILKSHLYTLLGQMDGVRKLEVEGKEILEVDFSNCKESKMIDILMQARKLIISENRKQLVLAVFNERNFLTQNFMDCFRTYQREEVIKLTEKQAVIGFNDLQKGIIKGYNIIFGRDIKMFDTRKEAIDFLTGE